MTIEEKARAYNEALEKAKKLQETCDSQAVVGWCEYLFPELVESEGEKIRKWCISHFKECINVIKDNDEYKEYLSNKVLAWLEKQTEQKPNPYTGVSFEYNGHIWGMCARDNGVDILLDKQLFKHLEKQGEKKSIDGLAPQEAMDIAVAKCFDEQKPTDKVEPKFHEGEWITNGDYTWKIVEVKPLDYILQSQDGNVVDDTISHVDEQFHSFTIQDAKDGDVLICKGNIKNSNGIKYERICLFNNLDNAFFTLTKTSNFVEEYNIDVNIDYPDNTVPATKEQKEILFMAMAGAGYTFDFEKKELKKIISEKQIKKNLQDNSFRRMFEQKPTWKPSDEQMEALKAMTRYCDIATSFDAYKQRIVESLYSELKKLREE